MAQTTFAQEFERLGALPATTDWRRPRPRSTSTARTSSPDRGRRGGPEGVRDPARGSASRHPRLTSAAREFVVALAADDRPRDGEGRRGHGLLPLVPAHGAQRGRRQPRPLLALARRVPRAPLASGSSAIRTRCSPRRRTTRSAPATSARASARSRACTRSGRERVRRWRELDRRDGRPERGVPRLADARRRLADRARAGSSSTSRRRCARRSATRTGSSRTRRTSDG